MSVNSQQLKSIYSCIKSISSGMAVSGIAETVGMKYKEVYQRCRTLLKRGMLSRRKVGNVIHFKVTEKAPDFSHFVVTAEESQKKVLSYIKESSFKLSGGYIAEVFGVDIGRSNPWLKALVRKGLIKKELNRIGMGNSAYYWVGSDKKPLHRVKKDLNKKHFKKPVEKQYTCSEMNDLATRAPVRDIFNQAMGLAL